MMKDHEYAAWLRETYPEGTRVRIKGTNWGQDRSGPEFFDVTGTVIAVEEEYRDVGDGESGPLIEGNVALMVDVETGGPEGPSAFVPLEPSMEEAALLGDVVTIIERPKRLRWRRLRRFLGYGSAVVVGATLIVGCGSALGGDLKTGTLFAEPGPPKPLDHRVASDWSSYVEPYGSVTVPTGCVILRLDVRGVDGRPLRRVEPSRRSARTGNGASWWRGETAVAGYVRVNRDVISFLKDERIAAYAWCSR